MPGALAQSLNWLGLVHARWLDWETAIVYFRDALTTISETEDPMVLVDILSALGVRLWLPAGRTTEAVTLLSLALAHPATDARVRQRCRKWLTKAEERLSTETFLAAVACGRQLTPEEAARETLATL